MTVILFCIALLAPPHSSWADTKDEARALADRTRGHLEALAGTAPDNATIPGYVGTAVRQSGYTDTNLSNNDTLPRDPNIRAAEEVMTSLPSTVTLDPTKFPNAMAVQRDPGAVFDLGRYLSGQYGDCSYTDGVNRVPVDVTCDRWLTSERRYCPLSREVEVKADVHYSCEEWEPNPEFTCTESTRVSCRKNSACPAYKVVRDSLTGDDTIYKSREVRPGVFESTEEVHGAPPLIRRLDDNGIGSYGPATRGSWRRITYRGSLWVSGRTVARLKRFVITGGEYKACLKISVNGKDVFLGAWRPADRSNYFHCDWPGSWHRIPRIDLLPHLKGAGWNNNIHFFFQTIEPGSFHINYELLVGCCESERRTTCTQ